MPFLGFSWSLFLVRFSFATSPSSVQTLHKLHEICVLLSKWRNVWSKTLSQKEFLYVDKSQLVNRIKHDYHTADASTIQNQVCKWNGPMTRSWLCTTAGRARYLLYRDRPALLQDMQLWNTQLASLHQEFENWEKKKKWFTFTYVMLWC